LLPIIGIFEENIKFICSKIPRGVQIIMIAIILLGVLTTVFLLVRILQHFWNSVPEDLSYIIVLGAQMKPNGPSLSLKRRLDRAIDYMNKNEKTMAILSGGQGKNEPMTEAEGMRLYMESKGIHRNRLLKEERSVNTYQNLMYSKKMVPEITSIEKRVGIVTSNFHMYRAKKIAEKAGLKTTVCLSSKTEPYMLLTAITREIIAIVKDFFAGNI